MRSFLIALALLTIFPVRFRLAPTAEEVARSRVWFPLVGVLLGVFLGSWLHLVSAWGRSPGVAALLVLVVWVVATGALHLDGFCDLCDGLFGGRTPEDRLRILKDPRRGTFGVAGAVLLLLGKCLALAECLERRPEAAPHLLAAAVAAARCLVLCAAAGAKYPRAEGTGKALVEATRGWEAVPFALAGLAVALAAWPGDGAWAAGRFAAGLAVVLAVRAACMHRLGGVPGDGLGAAVEAAEVVFLLYP